MNSNDSHDKRFYWLLGATLLNSVASLTALGLWFFSPNSNHHASTSAPSAEIASLPTPPPRPPRPSFHPAPPLPDGQIAPIPPPPNVDLPPPAVPGIFDPGGRTRTGKVKISPATQALAEKLSLDPQILALTFANDAGEIPANVAKRLERAFDSATSLAKNRQLSESQAQSLVAILTYYQFSVLREEKAAAPGPVDPVRIESIRERNLLDIGTSCGEETRKAADLEIDRW